MQFGANNSKIKLLFIELAFISNLLHVIINARQFANGNRMRIRQRAKFVNNFVCLKNLKRNPSSDYIVQMRTPIRRWYMVQMRTPNLFFSSVVVQKSPSPIVHQRSPRNGYTRSFHFWLCADLYSAPGRRPRNLVSEVLFQFESEHSDRGIMYFDIDPRRSGRILVFIGVLIYSGVVAPLFFQQELRCRVFIRSAISSLFVLRDNRIVALLDN